MLPRRTAVLPRAPSRSILLQIRIAHGQCAEQRALHTRSLGTISPTAATHFSAVHALIATSHHGMRAPSTFWSMSPRETSCTRRGLCAALTIISAAERDGETVSAFCGARAWSLSLCGAQSKRYSPFRAKAEVLSKAQWLHRVIIETRSAQSDIRTQNAVIATFGYFAKHQIAVTKPVFEGICDRAKRRHQSARWFVRRCQCLSVTKKSATATHRMRRDGLRRRHRCAVMWRRRLGAARKCRRPVWRAANIRGGAA